MTIVQFIEFVSITSLHFLSIVLVNLKLPFRIVNTLKSSSKSITIYNTKAIRIDGGEYHSALTPVIVQGIAPCVCGHTPWLQSTLVTEASIFTIKTTDFVLNILTHLYQAREKKSNML